MYQYVHIVHLLTNVDVAETYIITSSRSPTTPPSVKTLEPQGAKSSQNLWGQGP